MLSWKANLISIVKINQGKIGHNAFYVFVSWSAEALNMWLWNWLSSSVLLYHFSHLSLLCTSTILSHLSYPKLQPGLVTNSFFVFFLKKNRLFAWGKIYDSWLARYFSLLILPAPACLCLRPLTRFVRCFWTALGAEVHSLLKTWLCVCNQHIFILIFDCEKSI